MSQPAEAGKMDAFSRVAAWYFANPPATWRLTRRPSSWDVIARDGTYISSHRTRRDAAANLTAGPCAQAYYASVDWYLGYRREPRPLTDEERQVVAQVLSSTNSPPRFDGSHRDEMVVRINESTAESTSHAGPGLLDLNTS